MPDGYGARAESGAVGDKIDVNARQKSWLMSLGKVATDEPAAPAVKPAPAKANKE